MRTTEIDDTVFNHDSGWYPGNLTKINVPGQPEFEIETWKLMKFAAEQIRNERISRLEEMDALEILTGDSEEVEARLGNLKSIINP